MVGARCLTAVLLIGVIALSACGDSEELKWSHPISSAHEVVLVSHRSNPGITDVYRSGQLIGETTEIEWHLDGGVPSTVDRVESIREDCELLRDEAERVWLRWESADKEVDQLIGAGFSQFLFFTRVEDGCLIPPGEDYILRADDQ